MSDCKRPWLHRRAVHWNPFCGCFTFSGVTISSDEENSVFCCCTAVELPGHFCVLQMLPVSLLVNITFVIIAGNRTARDNVHCWIPHQPSIGEDAAPLLWTRTRTSGPKLKPIKRIKRIRIRCWWASYDQNPCNVISTLWITLSVHQNNHNGILVLVLVF